MLTNTENSIQSFLLNNDYLKLSLYLEDLIENEDVSLSVQISLGLAYLLSENEPAAQMMWLATLAENPEETDAIIEQLSITLDAEAKRQEHMGAIDMALLIRKNMFEVDPENIENLLFLVELITVHDLWHLNEIYFDELIEKLASDQESKIKESLLIDMVQLLLEKAPMHPRNSDFIDVCCQRIDDQEAFLQALFPVLIWISHSLRNPGKAAQIAEIYLKYHPDSVNLLGQAVLFCQDAQLYASANVKSERFYDLNSLPVHKIFASYLMVRGILSSGERSLHSDRIIKRHSALLETLNLEDVLKGNHVDALRIISSTFFLPYLNDSPNNIVMRRRVIQFACQSLSLLGGYPQQSSPTLNRGKPKDSSKIRVGYLSHCLKSHSVGWLARSLIQHHDRSQFEIYGYEISDYPNDGVQNWYRSQFDKTSCLEADFANNASEFYTKIKEDDVDILIDLDSITLDISCEILAMKPAPIQATWLGWDAIGMSAIDYFIADPYVLPENAQDYYTEKIWRLPDTYLAVDGFEVAVPTLKREDLGIATESVIFLTAQRGYKRHRDTAVLQMKIISGTPHSYLLIKGLADDQAIQSFFYEIADEVGVDRDRLRFLASDPSEAVHRANLRIADVVLDTYPYNGATTTMETLWMEVPIVTRVGEQFAARNSYTMMMNAGITEGIAWSAEEYIEWGVKLGTNVQLRQDVSWKLRQSKKLSPLWNGKKFARQMEEAYKQMWEIYQQQHSGNYNPKQL